MITTSAPKGEKRNMCICCFLLLNKSGGLLSKKQFLLKQVHSGAICGLLVIPPAETVMVTAMVTAVAAIRLHGCDHTQGHLSGSIGPAPEGQGGSAVLSEPC